MTTEAYHFPDNFQSAMAFHGHVCPGLAIGYRAAVIALRELEADRPEDEELVGVVENDACGVDALQCILGCTFGKGNLVFHDYGKQVFTVFSRVRGTAVRIALKTDALPGDAERSRELFSKIREGTATPAEIAEHEESRRQRIRALLERPAAELFDIRHIAGDPPARARIHQSLRCEECGENVMETRARTSDGRVLCIPCVESSAAKP